MPVPANVIRFEVLLYLSLLVDCLSAALIDRRPEGMSDAAMDGINTVGVIFVVLLILLVWLAARHRQGWARWALIGVFMLSTASILTGIRDSGWQAETVVDVVSTLLTAIGLAFSFVGDAQGWFRSSSLV